MYKNGDDSVKNVYGGYEKNQSGYKSTVNADDYEDADSFRRAIMEERDKVYEEQDNRV